MSSGLFLESLYSLSCSSVNTFSYNFLNFLRSAGLVSYILAEGLLVLFASSAALAFCLLSAASCYFFYNNAVFSNCLFVSCLVTTCASHSCDSGDKKNLFHTSVNF